MPGCRYYLSECLQGEVYPLVLAVVVMSVALYLLARGAPRRRSAAAAVVVATLTTLCLVVVAVTVGTFDIFTDRVISVPNLLFMGLGVPFLLVLIRRLYGTSWIRTILITLVVWIAGALALLVHGILFGLVLN